MARHTQLTQTPAIVTANAGDTAPYGGDPWSERLQQRFAELFETEVEVYPVGTGTVANGLCASVLTAPYGAIYVSDAAHVEDDSVGLFVEHSTAKERNHLMSRTILAPRLERLRRLSDAM